MQLNNIWRNYNEKKICLNNACHLYGNGNDTVHSQGNDG